jgi:hypothetical protein
MQTLWRMRCRRRPDRWGRVHCRRLRIDKVGGGCAQRHGMVSAQRLGVWVCLVVDGWTT